MRRWGRAGEFFRTLRTRGAGEQMVLEENFFIEMLLRQQGVITPLSDAVMAAYRAPFPPLKAAVPPCNGHARSRSEGSQPTRPRSSRAAASGC